MGVGERVGQGCPRTQLGALAFYVATQKAWPRPNMGLWLVKIHVNNINNAGRGRDPGKG